ncbi:MAG: MoxR family ATPase [Proteobacteria bacterium]|jgi:MoxR-like ATPase|nr:MoxR family ATPase [Desulfobacteraceae bacterium]MBU0733138.1 MoxR family ATPase [Pseudomonadota bacterium]MBL7101858.1 MoxR family ATPase [Desulfobacteraceae bacterium]MBL7173124.1 MoxR family ATPase [Desulfobacteraceae bacterium]MBU0990567.1 MoxR family ATPase [Pseudomonadota bacterium]
MDIQEITRRVEKDSLIVRQIMAGIEKVIVGQRYLIERMLIGLLCDGHLLLEGLPGLAKTTAVKTLAATIRTTFQRIQFTPDLLPADILGTQFFRPDTATFEIKKGPIFHNIILADEINRAPAKVQSALLEAMQELQITIGETTFQLARPFLVLATQNPIEQEGTYPLPEAQIDRFMLKIRVDYPSAEEEKEIMERVYGGATEEIQGVVDVDQIRAAHETMMSIHMEERIMDYIVRISMATRNPGKFGLDIAPMISYGASPRASIWLGLAARAHAFLSGRGYVTPQDVKSMAPDVLRHRIILSYEAEAEEKSTDDLIKILLERIEVP